MERKSPSIDSLVAFRNSQNAEARGTLVHMTRNVVVFEVYNPYSIVQLSEVLNDVRILRGERTIYSGRAVVSSIVATGLMLIVSATLVDPWTDLSGVTPGHGLLQEVQGFVQDWDTSHRIQPQYQVSVGNIAGFLGELSRWLTQLEATSGPGSAPALQREFTEEIEQGVQDKLAHLFGTFEHEASQVPTDQSVNHKAYARRQLHPFMLISPFIHRTYTKPLGYAGDYEMVNMIVRDPLDGPNPYSQILNAMILRSDGAQAHRNRIERLLALLQSEVRRVHADGRPMRILNIGCGPAVEVQRFVRNDPLCERCEFHLMDFNSETLAYARQRLTEAAYTSHHNPSIVYHHKSINELLKEASRGALGQQTVPLVKPDLIYCAGLFDYLSDRICTRLLQLFYNWANPGGLVVATNVHPRNRVRYFLEHLLEWNLYYRDEKQMDRLAPDVGVRAVSAERTGVNVFLEIRKETAARMEMN